MHLYGTSLSFFYLPLHNVDSLDVEPVMRLSEVVVSEVRRLEEGFKDPAVVYSSRDDHVLTWYRAYNITIGCDVVNSKLN